MTLRLALAAATCLVLPLAAHAQPIEGPYLALEGGTSIQSPVKYHGEIGNSTAALTTSGKAHYNLDYAGIVSLGYAFGDGFRVQLDANDFHTTLHEVDDATAGHVQASGQHTVYGPMLNLLYDIPVGLPIVPYVGAGGGYQWVKQGTHTGAGYNADSGGTKGSFAYDAIVGVSYPIAFVPGLSFNAEYRFEQLVNKTKYGSSVLGGYPPGNPNGGTVKFNSQTSNNFLIGVSYALFTPAPAVAAAPPPPAPAPAAAPAPAPARTFIVFFDWDKYNLTPRATEIISEAASDSKTSNVTTLDVSGYTDTSGTPDYNQGLSQRRAEAVAAQLEADGVSQSEISIHAYGETHLLVATGPGVREPQNRRVEIVLQ